MNVSTTTTARILAREYDCGIGRFDTAPLLWASDRAADEIGVVAAKAELRWINERRVKLGLPVAVFQFGHRMF